MLSFGAHISDTSAGGVTEGTEASSHVHEECNEIITDDHLMSTDLTVIGTSSFFLYKCVDMFST